MRSVTRTAVRTIGMVAVATAMSGCAGAPRACTGDLTVRTRADLAAAGDCTSLSGDLRIVGSDLVTLGGLGGLASVDHLVVVGNARLESLDGLHGLTHANGIYIADNPALRELNGLEQVTAVRGVSVLENASLLSVYGLDGVRDAGDITIAANPALRSLDGLSSLRRVENLDVERNASLRSLEGLKSVRGGARRAWIDGNDGISPRDAAGFEAPIDVVSNL